MTQNYIRKNNLIRALNMMTQWFSEYGAESEVFSKKY